MYQPNRRIFSYNQERSPLHNSQSMPCHFRTSTCRSFDSISSCLFRFPAIADPSIRGTKLSQLVDRFQGAIPLRLYLQKKCGRIQICIVFNYFILFTYYMYSNPNVIDPVYIYVVIPYCS